jgi:hypothetical protein
MCHSRACLETVLRLYYLRHSYERHGSFLPYFHIFLGNTVAADLEGQRDQLRRGDTATLDALRSTLLLCVKGTHDQGQIWLVAALIYKALRARMSAKDFNLFRTYALPDRFDDDSSTLVRDLVAHRPVPIINSGTQNIPTLEILAQLYDEISLEENIELVAPGTEARPAAARHVQ